MRFPTMPLTRVVYCIVLRCINFLVYEDATLEPGPGLNLLVGPNGSGKSTWANAILIGLGASPKVAYEDAVSHGK